MIKLSRVKAYILVFILIMTSLSNMKISELQGQVVQEVNGINTQLTTQSGVSVEENIVRGDGFQVIFKVKEKWDTGYNAELNIVNTQKAPLENWGIKFDLNADIENIWGANIDAKEGETYKIKNLGWNQDIAVGESVTVGLTATYKGYIEAPFNYQWIGKEVEASYKTYDIKFEVTSDWKDAFNGEISITNNTQNT